MANTDNHKLTTLRTECSRRKGAGLVNHSKQPFSISKDKAFYSCVRNYFEFAKKITVNWSWNVRLLVMQVFPELC